jgi:regulator of RNase E activity RraA
MTASIGFPISCGGVLCEYGDIILAGNTGVAGIPGRLVGKVIAESDAVIEKEAAVWADLTRRKKSVRVDIEFLPRRNPADRVHEPSAGAALR